MIHDALVPRIKILLPPLHIKLGLVKQFVKALNTDSAAVQHICSMFSTLSEAKLKGGIFTGPQIRKMLKCQELEAKMDEKEKAAWIAFRQTLGFWAIINLQNIKM